ncbi:MAG TPA: DUF3830 family protein [Nitrososphaerales archaeon]|nr:DUF3830 family protein [Nitrososphaerales archaeon]
MSTIILDIDGEPFSANLHPGRAPKTVEALLKLLPYRSRVVHARFSGEAIWIPLPADFSMNVPLENQTSYPSRGELLYYPGFVSDKEVLIPYGATIFSSRVGQLPGNHFATVEGKLDKLAELGTRVLWEGLKKLPSVKGPPENTRSNSSTNVEITRTKFSLWIRRFQTETKTQRDPHLRW